ncbi:DUF58 domain-containing protein [Sansalvadorimonas sp. 2012CJ34-2]|uniref:DUF58 domain-containing protein n=1 Tax=Parendozoicomonas callyspongiae TaxID=2942213 RepID=A0ABT0PD79_9GAMM|nr:DUF58 domain-containing protein [Sansalvadorimonas sp. 2012CJ34-2]MCL6268702.1 DUF58 domain-containing protein [Sansalvadorimonas sp. 2012CJ34-2]
MSSFASIEFHKRWLGWLNRRIPPSNTVTLSQKSLFILPTKAGFTFLLVAFLIFLAGVNYQNSLSYAVSFFMVSLFQIGLWHTWRNLAGITLVARGADSVHVGQMAGFRISCCCADGLAQQGIMLGWPDHGLVRVDPEGDEATATIHCSVHRRGLFHPERVRVESVYPVGLFKAWSWVDLDQEVLVWPALQDVEKVGSTGISDDGHREVPDGMDDFAGHRSFMPTDSAAQVDWKVLARSEELLVRQFHALAGDDLWLDLETAPGRDTEQKLGWLASQCVLLGQGSLVWGMKLGRQTVALGQGEHHAHKCLDALALYGSDPNGRSSQ